MPVPDPWSTGWVIVFPKLPARCWYVRQLACGGWVGVVIDRVLPVDGGVAEPTRTHVGGRSDIIASVTRPEVRRGLPVMVNDELQAVVLVG